MMTGIAAETDSSIGSLYQFFPTKPLIAETLHVRELEALSNVIEVFPVPRCDDVLPSARDPFAALRMTQASDTG